AFLIQSFSFSPISNDFTVHMNRAGKVTNHNPVYYDVIRFDPANGRLTIEKALEVEEVLHRHLNFPKGTDAKVLTENTLGIIDRETAALAQLHHTMMENAENLRASYEVDATERRRKFEELQLQAEEDIRKREFESSERIAAEKAALDDKIKKFDQSDHMFVGFHAELSRFFHREVSHL
ncbi:hypothetical protein PDO_5131, partial [Rhizobium sp. PDO1-076]|uniref:hypothetical protein n=2 Tax=Rhizobium TaxID=379 RepID=UPI00024E327C